MSIKLRICTATALAGLSLFGGNVLGQFPPAPGTGPGVAETIEAIDAARVTTRILYVTAHPDDESSAVLTYLARGLHAEVALLSLTRGEGGQNALGPEQAPQLGLIRTEELLAATRGYGVKLFFTRAKDFGFSKTPEETERIWGDQVLEDMVRVIRTFRPNIVINNWGGVHGGHGHHQASGLLTPKAVALAADAKAYPEMAREDSDTALTPWNGDQTQVRILNLERGVEHPTGFVLPLDEVSPLYGKTWREIGIDAFANHRTQGVSVFLGSPFFRRPIALIAEDGKPIDAASLAVPLSNFAKCVPEKAIRCGSFDATEVERKIAEAREATLKLDWKKATVALADAAAGLRQLVPSGGEVAKSADRFSGDQLFTFGRVQANLERALSLAAGYELTTAATSGDLVTGESVEVTAAARCRAEAACKLGKIELGDLDRVDPNLLTETSRKKDSPENTQFTASAKRDAPKPATICLQKPNPPVIAAVTEEVTIGSYTFTARKPVLFIAADSTHVTRVPLRIVPAYTLAVDPKQAIQPLKAPRKSYDTLLRIHSYSTNPATVSVGADIPQGWTGGKAVEVKFDGPGDHYAKITITPPQNLGPGNYVIAPYVQRGDEKFLTSLEPFPSMPTLFSQEPARSVVHAFDIVIPENLRVGYISAEGEPIPEALRMLGIRVEMLDAAALNFGDLSRYDAIVVGVRAYELRDDLRAAKQRLLDYVSTGGTLVVQYQRDFAWNPAYAPYPAKIEGGPSKTRITDENSPVQFLKPDDPLLGRPNKISAADFRGWVQERGLYFWSDFDKTYTPLLAMNDPGESELDGALVYAKYGKGTYIYTGIAFFRQLPEGVSGAYRLFVNLLSASRVN